MTGIIITKFITVCTQQMEVKHVCFLLRGRLQKIPFLCEVDERSCGKWGLIVWPLYYSGTKKPHNLLLVLIVAVFQCP